MGKRRNEGEMTADFTSLNVCYAKEVNKVSYISTDDERKVMSLNRKLGIRKGFITILK